MADFGLSFEGSQHSGVDDAKNLARLLVEVMKVIRGSVEQKSEAS